LAKVCPHPVFTSRRGGWGYNKHQGFSLFELLIAISIIAILILNPLKLKTNFIKIPEKFSFMELYDDLDYFRYKAFAQKDLISIRYMAPEFVFERNNLPIMSKHIMNLNANFTSIKLLPELSFSNVGTILRKPDNQKIIFATSGRMRYE